MFAVLLNHINYTSSFCIYHFHEFNFSKQKFKTLVRSFLTKPNIMYTCEDFNLINNN